MNTFFIHCSEVFPKCFGYFRITAGSFAGGGVFGEVFCKSRLNTSCVFAHNFFYCRRMLDEVLPLCFHRGGNYQTIAVIHIKKNHSIKRAGKCFFRI